MTETGKRVPDVSSPSMPGPGGLAILIRIFGWVTLAGLAAFLLNDFLTFWAGWPGAAGFEGNAHDVLAWFQAGLYAAALMLAGAHVLAGRESSLREDHDRVAGINSFLIRAGFWSVLLIGIADVSLAFLNGEDLLGNLVGETLARELMRAEVRGAYVHMPLVALSIVIATFVRPLGIMWLSLLIVVAELLIVMFRFVFSYEQVYMADLVRFWYAALFLFGSAYTLREEGHVRVDVFYARFGPRAKALVNMLGTVLLGMPFCWLILFVGTSGKTGIINAALLSFEIEGLGDGMYILYLMTVFMAAFAITMLIEFVAVLFNAAADWQREPQRPGHDARTVP